MASMIRPLLMLAAALAATLATTPAAAQYDADRAIRNYQALIRGTRHFHDLSAIEQQEVREVDRLLRREVDTRSGKQRCIDDEIARSDGTVTYLERRVIELKCSQH